MIITYLGVGPGDARKEINDTTRCQTIFSFLKMLYRDHLTMIVDYDGDDA